MDAIEKAENGEDVTIVYLGGSITQGDGASNSDNCYANLSFNMFTEKFAFRSFKNALYKRGNRCNNLYSRNTPF